MSFIMITCGQCGLCDALHCKLAADRTANAEAHGRAVARTVQPLVGHSVSGAE